MLKTTMLMISVFVASAAYANPCDALFLNRIQGTHFAAQAATCYQDLIQNATTETDATIVTRFYDQQSLSLAWVILKSKSAQEKRTAINQGLALSSKMLATQVATAHYWRSVFVTFDCRDVDGSSVLPRCMFRNLGYLQSLLLEAMKISPTVHQFGPDRVYGIMYMEMPKVVGGSNAIAYEHLKKAYINAPQLTMNGLHFAKVLIKLDQKEEAKKILNEIIAKTMDELDPASIPESLEDQAEAKKMLTTHW